MQYAVGDKVVHPSHGPGQIISVERKELIDEAKRYYVIQIPVQDLTVYVPWRKVDKVGVRPAMSRAKLSRVLETLRARPRHLPPDHKDRQQLVWEKLKTGHVIQIAEVVRDLVWHKELAHLTKKDSDYLDRGRRLLAAEMALVSDSDIDDAERRINDELAASIAGGEA
ncbi:MAG: CarD family transcriptional regulator [Anaerolineae bacterium]